MSNLEYYNQFKAAYYTQFSLPKYCLPQISTYKRLVWSTRYFLDCWNKNVGSVFAGTILRYGKVFHVEFVSGCSLGKLRSAIEAGYNPQITLSFRSTSNSSLPNLVLVDFMRVSSEEIV